MTQIWSGAVESPVCSTMTAALSDTLQLKTKSIQDESEDTSTPQLHAQLVTPLITLGHSTQDPSTVGFLEYHTPPNLGTVGTGPGRVQSIKLIPFLVFRNIDVLSLTTEALFHKSLGGNSVGTLQLPFMTPQYTKPLKNLCVSGQGVQNSKLIAVYLLGKEK